MKKIAIFVEGQGEQIFVMHLLYYLLEPAKFRFECLRLRAKINPNNPSVRCTSYRINPNNPSIRCT